MKLFWLLWGLLISLCVAMALILMFDQPDQAHGFNHPEFATMQRGGPGLDRLAGLLWLGWLFGILEIGLFVCCLAIGVRRGGELGVLKKPILVGLVLYCAIFSLLISSYRSFAEQGSGELIGSFPWPTAIMLYGLWPAPLFFLGLYIWSFDRWICTDKDIERFQKILQARHEREENKT